MDKLNELTKIQKEEEKLLVASVMDKIKFVNTRENFKNTKFLDMAQIHTINEVLKKIKFERYEFFGGFENAERKMLIVYSEKIFTYLKEKNTIYNQIMKCIKIVLPKEQQNEYTHKTYLGAIMKLGIKREMIGDIIVNSEGAEILIASEIENFLIDNLKLLTRFKKARIETINIENVNYIEPETKIIKINISSMRLDAIISELAHVSRNEAQNIINDERVLINFKEELSYSKKVEEGTIISIRGKGRFKIIKISGMTKSGRLNLDVETYN